MGGGVYVEDIGAFTARRVTLQDNEATEWAGGGLHVSEVRHARFFGMHMVQYQAYLTAAAYNLQRIFTLTKWSTA